MDSGHALSRSAEDLGGSLRTPLRANEAGAGGEERERVTPPPRKTKSALETAKREAQAFFLEPPREPPAKDHALVRARNTPKWSILSKALLALAIYFAVGIVAVSLINKDLFGTKTSSFADAFYFCAVTLTTVGYGDLVPSTTHGKLFTCAYFLVGFVVVSGLISGAADYLVQKQEAALVHATDKRNLEAVDFEAKEYSHAEAALFKMYVAGTLLLLVSIIGTVFLMAVEHKDLVDAFYCVMVTATTLGYGDQSFATASGRFFGAIWIILSTICLAQFLLYVAEYRTVLRQLMMAHWVLHRKTTLPDLEAADMDGDGYVSMAEFVVYKLKELQKIDEQDVAEVLKEFRSIDHENTGKIRVGDPRLPQKAGTSGQ